MVEVILTVFALLAVVLAVAFAVVQVRLIRRGRSPVVTRLEADLAEALENDYLEGPPSVRLRSVENGVVPTVRLDLDMATPPSGSLTFDYVADVLETLHPAAEGLEAAHYAIEFTFGPDGLFVSGPCQRVAVTLEQAAAVCDQPGFGPTKLQRAVEAGDDGDDDTPPVRWGPCR